MRTAPPPQAVPVAWFKGHMSPGTPHGPAEYDVDCYYGEDPPDDSEGWQPIYAHPPQPAPK
jgi:hypothetical protein